MSAERMSSSVPARPEGGVSIIVISRLSRDLHVNKTESMSLFGLEVTLECVMSRGRTITASTWSPSGKRLRSRA